MKKRANNRICPTCKNNKAESYSTYCKNCACERQKKWLKKNGYSPNKTRKQMIRKMIIEKKNKPCSDCKMIYPWYVMDFDHVNGVKKFILAQSTSHRRSVVAIKEEMKKCEIVCANCHRIRTFERRINGSSNPSL